MSVIDVFGMCIKNLVKRKLRTLLTLLGVMIGTGSIILMISLGLATDAQFAQMIEDRNLDMTVIGVWQQGGWHWTPELGNHQVDAGPEITDAVVDRILRIPAVSMATPIIQGRLVLRSGPYAMESWNVTGIRPEAMAHMGYNVEYGRLLQEGDEFAAVFSSRTERHFFDMGGDQWWAYRVWGDGDRDAVYVDVMNDPIRMYYDINSLFRGRFMGEDDEFGIGLEEAMTPVRSFDLEVVGVLEHVVDMWGWDGGNDTIIMDIETLQMFNQLQTAAERRAQEEGNWWGGTPVFSAIPDDVRDAYDSLMVRVHNMDDTSRIAETIRDMGFNVSFEGDWIEQQRQLQAGMETLLAAIAAISMLVAAMNIANTMITSVTERTREIGIMKVIGATVSDVRKLFLAEAISIGLLGGIFGITLALFGSYAMNNFDIEFLNNLNMGVPDWMRVGDERPAISLITPWLCALALAVAGGVGIVSGFYPAWRATRLSALAAIRGE
ncbi:MAG: ABC transporter permease [Defluviitaleaceae bacterium]|nr:ABC transporter permease [Defluviitaleaceae bacterium]MCL2262338.1 ABC transporter permease [Defluviitaleaceae bacterium]